MHGEGWMVGKILVKAWNVGKNIGWGKYWWVKHIGWGKTCFTWKLSILKETTVFLYFFHFLSEKNVICCVLKKWPKDNTGWKSMWFGCSVVHIKLLASKIIIIDHSVSRKAFLPKVYSKENGTLRQNGNPCRPPHLSWHGMMITCVCNPIFVENGDLKKRISDSYLGGAVLLCERLKSQNTPHIWIST